MIRKILIGAVAVGAVTALGACASQKGAPSKSHQVAKTKSNMVCFKDNDIGSHIAHVRCVTRQQYRQIKKANEKSANDFRNTVNSGPTANATEGGGGGR